MTLTNVRLILAREIRDQLRDRRTLFMIFVLPVLLYPLLGTTMFQMMQFRRERPTSVLVVGAGNLSEKPCLFEDGKFAPWLFGEMPKEAGLLELTLDPEPLPGKPCPDEPREQARLAVQTGQYDAALYFPPDFAHHLQAFREVVKSQAKRPSGKGAADEAAVALQVPLPAVFCNKAKDRSVIASARVRDVLDRWAAEVGKSDLKAAGIPVTAARPFAAHEVDVAGPDTPSGTAFWPKILPVLLLIWALTGAFYPAVDLCAGEKERGTLETLLSSPAERTEIAMGKLLTIMLFSMITSILNLLSVGVTGWLIFGRMASFSAPPPLAVLWLGLALVPVSALFSALCLALAAFARSTKEGQYYLMPLLLVTLPLAILPMMPGVELNLGNSLIPVAGIVLLLKSLLEGAYWHALQFVPIVVGVTLVGCWLAVRWAVDQFNSESVLFRESERFGVRLWVRHLVRDRQPTPTVAAAVFCGVLILLIRFVLQGVVSAPENSTDFLRATALLQLAAIAMPALALTFMLTGSPRETLLLRLPSWRTIPAAVALAVAFHPVVMVIQVAVAWLYPFPEDLHKALQQYDQLLSGANLWRLVLVMALAPALCEELAFRGFILSGFRGLGNKWRAIVASAVLFGLAHPIFHQSLITCVIGLIVAYIAIQTRSILPGMIFHFLHNSLAIVSPRVIAEATDRWPVVGTFASPAGSGELMYSWEVVAFGGLATILLLAWFTWRPEGNSAERDMQEAFERSMA